MADAIRTGRPHRASGALGQHVLEIAEAIGSASVTGAHVRIDSSSVRPEPMPAGLLPGISVAEPRT
jgi:hypothetical protein